MRDNNLNTNNGAMYVMYVYVLENRCCITKTSVSSS